MVVFKGFEVSIKVNGTALKEYENTEKQAAIQDNHVVRYVECVSGSSFEIHFQALDQNFAGRRIAGTMARTWVDGISTKNSPLGVAFPYRGIVDGRLSCRSGQTYLHKFSFKELKLVDNDLPSGINLHELIKKAGTWGTIELKLYRIERFKQIVSTSDFDGTSATNEMDVNEKILKGRPVSHKIGYGVAIPQSKTYQQSRQIDEENAPFLQYTFHYMSKASLQSVGLIPRSPSPVRLEDRDTQELSREELMALVEMQRDRLQTQQLVKQEHDRRSYSSPAMSAPKRKRGDGDGDGDEISLVAERNVRSRKITQEPIDLTDD